MWYVDIRYQQVRLNVSVQVSTGIIYKQKIRVCPFNADELGFFVIILLHWTLNLFYTFNIFIRFD